MQASIMKAGCIVVAFVCLAAVTIPTIPAKPYKLEYPAYFSNRLYIPADNPLTEEGCTWAGVCFMKPSCRPIIAFPVRTVTSRNGPLRTGRL